jgi:hypothetical protein
MHNDKHYHQGQDGYYEIPGRFPGQQEGERILHVVRTHWLMLFGRLSRTIFLFVLFVVAWLRGGPIVTSGMPDIYWVVWLVVPLLFLFVAWWDLKLCNNSIAFVTDRRLIRFTPTFPVTYSKRMVFWREVLKTRTKTESFVWRLLKVGNLEVVPKTGIEQSVILRYVFLYDDLANYFDKLVHLTNAEPESLKRVRPFGISTTTDEIYTQRQDELVGHNQELRQSNVKMIGGVPQPGDEELSALEYKKHKSYRDVKIDE